MSLFFVGILEMLIITSWTTFVTEKKIIASGAITFVNILIWYYVLERIVNNLDNFSLVLLYAGGCALGTVLGTLYFNKRNKDDKKTILCK